MEEDEWVNMAPEIDQLEVIVKMIIILRFV